MNAYDAIKAGLVNEIISDGLVGKNQLIEKLKTQIAIYKLVKHIFLTCVFHKKNYVFQYKSNSIYLKKIFLKKH